MEKYKQSRRNFMKNSAVGASVFGLDFSMPSWLFSTNAEREAGNAFLAGSDITFIRENITLTQQLLNDIIDKNGATALTIVADTISLSQTIKVPKDVQLTLIAINIKGNRNAIDLSQPKNLTRENFRLQAGYSSKALTLHAKRISGVSINASGSDGADGVNGDDFKIINYITGSFEKPTAGEHGATAGSGGNVTILFTESNDTFVNTKGGKGGKGGIGGKGGVYCAEVYPAITPVSVGKPSTGLGGISGGKPGSVGGTIGTGGGKPAPLMCKREERINDSPNGMNADNGKDGVKTVQKLSDDQWYVRTNQICPAWSDYRVRLGEFYYRSINNPINTSPNAALTTGLLRSRHAVGHIFEALALNPDNAMAKLWKTRMYYGHTPIGLQRNIDVTADVKILQDAYSQCYGVVDSIHKQAINYENKIFIGSGFEAILRAEISGLEALQKNIGISLNQKVMPELSRKQAELESRLSKDRSFEVQISTRQRDIANRPFTFGELVTTVGAVAGVASAIFSGGTTLIAASKNFMAVLRNGTEFLDSLDTIKSFGSIKDTYSDYKKGDKMEPDSKTGVYAIDNVLANEALQFKDALQSFNAQKKEIITTKKNVIFKIEEITNALKRVDTGDAELNRLIQEKAANMEQAMTLKKDIAYLELDKKVAEDQMAEFTKATEQISKSIGRVNNPKRELEEFSYMLSRATYYMNILTKFVFLTARRLEIWQFNDYSQFMRFDIGHVHPDLIEDNKYFQKKEYAEALSKDFNRSWAEFASIVELKQELLGLETNNWTTYTLRLSFKGDTISHLKANPNSTLSFTVSPDDATLKDLKLAVVAGVKVAYIGAKTNGFQSFNARLHQSGRLSQRFFDNSIRQAILEGHVDTIPDVSINVLPEIIGSTPLTIRDRAVFSQYELFIPSAEIAQQGIDLSNLSEIQVGFTIKYTTSSAALRLRR